jgi:hypothetical protein
MPLRILQITIPHDGLGQSALIGAILRSFCAGIVLAQ